MEKIPVRNLTLQKEPLFSGSFTIRTIEELLTQTDIEQETHRHNYYFLLALQKGAGQHSIDFTQYPVADNTLFIMRPGQIHSLHLKQGSTGYMLQFTTDIFSPTDTESVQLLRNATCSNIYQLPSATYAQLHQKIATIFTEYSLQQPYYTQAIRATITEVCISLNRLQTESCVDTNDSYIIAQCNRFIQLLETHMATHKQVAQYAEMMNLSTYQLNSITKTASGKTASEVINGYLVLEAKRYLLATTNQVNQIAYHLGYDDVSYFIRFFKKHTGHSPETFRNNFI